MIFIYSTDSSYIFITPIYLACIFLFLYGIYRKYHDKNLIIGILISAAFYVIIDVNLFGVLSYLLSIQFIGYFIFCFICGIMAGLINEDIKRGAISGAIGMIIAMALTYPYIYFIIFVFGIHFPFQALPSILGGAIGGTLGSQIRRSFSFKKKTIIKPQ
ncbi:MAG: hypothetical protein KAX18_09300 [Candidatus Lokiarchaeota archaeon]|nr:hypothetical protein [Candidatus Lokiarchaeota archaeon]